MPNRPDLRALAEAAATRHLSISCTLGPRDCAGSSLSGTLPRGTLSLLMLSPDEPGFWPAFKNSPEYLDGRPDPMDRWSHRVIGDWADEIGATALFPFGGPPFLPFLRWALASGQIHGSPVGMLVQEGAGLYVSFRGALALPWSVGEPSPRPSPCITCTRPCLTACPVNALGPADGYDVAACRAYLRSSEGQDCLEIGCLVRRSCPVGRTQGRLPEHSAYHMTQFLETRWQNA